ncbi:hypothetical protein A2U01_0112624, partial [Trifolium medium]|nr:hypothetical protein [Trifolium medium]
MEQARAKEKQVNQGLIFKENQ